MYYGSIFLIFQLKGKLCHEKAKKLIVFKCHCSKLLTSYHRITLHNSPKTLIKVPKNGQKSFTFPPLLTEMFFLFYVVFSVVFMSSSPDPGFC